MTHRGIIDNKDRRGRGMRARGETIGGSAARSARARSGFSLIELLVVIAIITILLSVLLPALPAIRDAARQTKCLANVRSIGQAVELYKSDFNQRYPDARFAPRPVLLEEEDLIAEVDDPRTVVDEQFRRQALNALLDPYMAADSEGYRCPGDPGLWSVGYEAPAPNGETFEKQVGMSYTFGDQLFQLPGRSWQESFYSTFEFMRWSDENDRYESVGFSMPREARGRFESEPSDVAILSDFDNSTILLDDEFPVFSEDLFVATDEENPNRRSVTVDPFHTTRTFLYADGRAEKGTIAR